MTIIFFYILIGSLIFHFVLEFILDHLNSTRWSDELPSELGDIYDAEKYRTSQRYERTTHRFSRLSSTVSFAVGLAFLAAGGFGWADGLVRQVTGSSILMALLFFGVLGLAADCLSLPFSIYATFVIEERFGFNRTTPITFALDTLKGWLVSAVIGSLVLSAVIVIFEFTGPWFWVPAWVLLSSVMAFFTAFYSSIIVPLFNRQVPLEAGELRDAIEGFAKRVGFRLDNIFVMDGSKRSSKANAYFSGLGARKRIVLFDTLIKDHPVDELVAVLAHEIGHYRLKHTLVFVIASVVQMGVMLYVFSLFVFMPELSRALGATEPSFHLGILAFGLLYSPLSMVMGLVMNAVSRRCEYAADRFAADNFRPGPLASALRRLSVNNLSNLRPHPAYVFFHYSHPPLLARLQALTAREPGIEDRTEK